MYGFFYSPKILETLLRNAHFSYLFSKHFVSRWTVTKISIWTIFLHKLLLRTNILPITQYEPLLKKKEKLENTCKKNKGTHKQKQKLKYYLPHVFHILLLLLLLFFFLLLLQLLLLLLWLLLLLLFKKLFTHLFSASY